MLYWLLKWQIKKIWKDDDKKSELKEVLWQEYPKVELSRPDEDSPKIRTYFNDRSYFASKGVCRSEGSRLYSIQDLVTIETSHYCSPDWRSYWNFIDKINLFPNEEDFPEEYDNSFCDDFESWQFDYLAYDKENKKNILLFYMKSISISRTLFLGKSWFYSIIPMNWNCTRV